MQTGYLISMQELSHLLSVDEAALKEMTRSERLPHSFTTSRGLCIRARDLSTWKRAIERNSNVQPS